MSLPKLVVIEEVTKPAEDAPTLREVLYSFTTSGRHGANTIHSYRSIVNRCLQGWMDLKVTAITPEMVEAEFMRITEDHGEASANQTFYVVRALLSFVRRRYKRNGIRMLSTNPVEHLSDMQLWHDDKPRKNIIEPHELKKFWAAVHDMPHLTTRDCTVRDYMVLLLLSGLRKEEGLKLEWAKVDLDNGFITIDMTDLQKRRAASKNGQVHKLALSDYLWDMLKRRKADAQADDKYVFPGRSRKHHFTCPYGALTWIRGRSGLDFTLHDLRRTFCTYALEELMIEERWVKRLMNHKFKDVTNRHYAGQIPEKLRPFMQQITDFVLEKVGVTRGG